MPYSKIIDGEFVPLDAEYPGQVPNDGSDKIQTDPENDGVLGAEQADSRRDIQAILADR